VRRVTTATLVLLSALLLLTGCGPKNTPAATSPAASGAAAAAPTAAAPSDPAASLAGASVDANGCPTSNTIPLAKTKFALHAGLAFGTFHRYIYKPFKAGSFTAGTKGRVLALVKAGATGLFDAREIRLATEDVKASPALCKVLAAPLRKLGDTFDSMGSKIKGGDTSGVEDANAQAAMISSASASGGAPIAERTDESAG